MSWNGKSILYVDVTMALSQQQIASKDWLQNPCQPSVPHWWHLSAIMPLIAHRALLQGQFYAGG